MTSYEYRANGSTVVLHREEGLVGVRFREPARRSTRQAVASQAGVTAFQRRLEVPNEKFTILNLAAPPAQAAAPERAARRESTVDLLRKSDQVARVTPVFRYGSSQLIATDRILVGLAPGVEVAPLAQAVGGEVVESTGDEHVIQLAESLDPLAAARQVAALEGVQYAEPDFVNIVPKLARRSSARLPARLDAFDRQQYAINITRSVEAWSVVRGRKEIKIAILDEGVDTLHEDLQTAIVGSFDAADNDTFQEPNPWDGHGTACAGLAAATHNGLGVLGVAGGCSLLAVRIAYSERPGGNWITTNLGIARAIDWSWQNGADVLSNSWGGGAPSTRISRAFERARTEGRQGKGCVVVIAAGNENIRVGFPANLPNVVCVAASNEFDEPKTPTSHDGESWWGSCFGPEVTLAAPGVHNYTTDITGVNGYSASPDEPNYVPDFNGTSSATPIVAGGAALVLSANADLTEAEVRAILTETADKVGSVIYDAAGHHPRMGFGRINVHAAVTRAAPAIA